MTTNGHKSPQTGAARLREMLNDEQRLINCPGVYDGLTARIALNAGYDCLYMTGAGTAASRLGMPDLGLLTMNDMLMNAAMIASLDPSIPLIADADTGYGGPIMVARTVKAYIQAGVAGLHLEDQALTKRCGHLAGKEIVDEETYYSRISAAVLAREEMRRTTGGDVVLIARTDALQSFGYDEAIKRLRRCIEIGADVAFLEGLTSVEECRNVVKDLPGVPILYNMVPGGVSPDLTVQEAQDIGFRVMIHPGACLIAVLDGVTRNMADLRETGRIQLTEKQKQQGVKGIFGICGLKECLAFDAEAGGKAYTNGV